MVSLFIVRPQLTVTSVVHGDRPRLDANVALVRRLNPEADLRWRMVVNPPAQSADRVDDPGEYEIVPGAALSPEEALEPGYRSLHHAKGLNAGVAVPFDTRFALLLDADFYIVRPGWVREVLEHMDAAGLSFFGAPYHPRSLNKLRYFPCAVCLFVDLQRVDAATLDFTPGALAAHPSRSTQAARWALGRLGMDIRTRPQGSTDTGIRVYRRFLHDPEVRSECVQPVFTAQDARGFVRDPAQLVLERVLPDPWCLIPSRPSYLSDRRFAQLGAPDLYARGCEEYVWRDEPFAFHLRGAQGELREGQAPVDRVLAAFE